MLQATNDHPDLALGNRRKLTIETSETWQHHRDGWTYVVNLIRNDLHCEDGVTFINSVDDMVNDGIVMNKPWVGFVHQVPHNNLRWFPDLSRLLQDSAWLSSRSCCLGLFVLSSYLKRYLLENQVGVPVNRVFYPTPPPERSFSLRRFNESARPKLLFIGEYMRNFQSFYDLSAPGYEKLLLRPEAFTERDFITNDSVSIIDRVSDIEYDTLLENSVVFLSLLDAPANTTIIECMVRGTPIIVNKLEGVVEYLGEEYPLYYENLDDASLLLSSRALLVSAHEYLSRPDIIEKLVPNSFLRAFQNTAIYRSLPIPRSQSCPRRVSCKEESNTELPPTADAYDVTVVICSFNRVSLIPRLLQCFAEQDFQGRFEIILWNNCFAAREELDAIINQYKTSIDITLIHSSTNFYCAIRLAVPHLAHSKLLLICDDDVLPNPSYISTFLSKHREYGENAVLCCRGHVFRQHELDEEEPHHFWEDYEYLEFYNETVDDRQVHFMHADNCLIPKHLMLKASEFDLNKSEFALVDDYWLSFVLSHHLKIPIWKIRGDHIMRLTESADDPKVALFHNPLVREQRVNFYVEHMRAGWPYAAKLVTDHSSRCQRQGDTDRAVTTDIWKRGFCGANISSESSENDLRAASKYGISVARLGATGGGADFSYLLDPSATRAVLNETTIARLVNTIRRAERCGLNVILTLTDLPGRIFSPGVDLRLWKDPGYQMAVVQMWGDLAKALRTCKNVIGYDVINEPFLPDEVGKDFWAEGTASASLLNRLYSSIINEIRKHDIKTTIILESSNWASPLSFGSLEPNGDPNVVYSFHMYAPHVFTDRSKNQGKICYPGLVPERPVKKWAECQYWDRSELMKLLSYVSDWQEDHGIPSHRIYVSEFGTCRDVPGAREYLADLVSIFAEKGWNWTVYAFRENAWDAMDYELGSDIENMLYRTESSLFRIVAEHFK